LKIQDKRKHFAVLIDPDDTTEEKLDDIIARAKASRVSFFFVGGSILVKNSFESTIRYLKEKSDIPVIIFPGDTYQISSHADAILFLSLISGRNADLLIGKHVLAAPILKANKIEVLSTGYMLIDSGKQTTASYMSHSIPIPHDKESIAIATAMAGELLGMKLIYMDGGSGASNRISLKMIGAVKKHISIPLIIGGGINSAERAQEVIDAGADIIVVGTAIENDPSVIDEIGKIF